MDHFGESCCGLTQSGQSMGEVRISIPIVCLILGRIGRLIFGIIGALIEKKNLQRDFHIEMYDFRGHLSIRKLIMVRFYIFRRNRLRHRLRP